METIFLALFVVLAIAVMVRIGRILITWKPPK